VCGRGAAISARPVPAHRRRPAGAAEPEENYDDLRAGLPAEFQGAEGEQVSALWVAWQTARTGYQAGYLARTFALPAEAAQRLVALAHPKPPR